MSGLRKPPLMMNIQTKENLVITVGAVCKVGCGRVCANGPPPGCSYKNTLVLELQQRDQTCGGAEIIDMPSNAMHSTCTRHHHTTRGLMWKVSSWRSVWILYSLICVMALQEGSEGAKARCGRELVADLEFVCGDRGFYRGKPGGPRTSGPRSRGKGIVEQCCVRGCDLQHLESYCAKPKRGRRHAPPTLQTVEDQFWQVFQKRYQKLAEMNRDQETTSQREQALYQSNFRSSVLLNSVTKTPNRPPSAHQNPSTDQITSGATFIPQNR